MTNVACPQCGDIKHQEQPRELCRHCLAQGHMYRMMTWDELKASFQRNWENGYHSVAHRLALIATALDATNKQTHD